MNVLSLFDGMSCGQIALERIGIKADNYFASEIDKHAIKVTQHNYPNTKQLGSVLNVKGADLPKIDLLIGGSPCQGFSFAGKQLNFDDPRSKLFFEFVRLLNECEPKYFLLENVRMRKDIQDSISELLGIEPIMINSALVSAQDRKRLYWTNIPNIVQPENKYIYLKDILEKNDIDESYYTVEKIAKRFKLKDNAIIDKEKSCTIGNIGNRTFQLHRVFSIDCKASTLMARTNGRDNYIIQNERLRKLTCIEHERLQTVPDNYTKIVPKTYRRQMLGNGWTVDVITHIFKDLLNGGSK